MGSHYDRAAALFELRRYDLAERELRQELAANPEDSRALMFLSLLLTRIGKPESAIEVAADAIRARADLPHGHYAQALAFRCSGPERWDQAEAALTEAIRLDPENAGYHAELAYLLFLQDRYSEAWDAAEAGLKIDPDQQRCGRVLSLILAFRGRGREARETMQAVLARDPAHPNNHAVQGWVLLKQRRFKGAWRHFRESLRLDPDLSSARDGACEALIGLTRLWIRRVGFFSLGAFAIGLALHMFDLADRLVVKPFANMGFYVGVVSLLFAKFAPDSLICMFFRIRPFTRGLLSAERRAASNRAAIVMIVIVAVVLLVRYVPRAFE